MRKENGLTDIEKAIDKLSRHHIRHIKAYDPNEGIIFSSTYLGIQTDAPLLVKNLLNPEVWPDWQNLVDLPAWSGWPYYSTWTLQLVDINFSKSCF